MELKFTLSLFLVALIAFASALDIETESPTDPPPDVTTPTEPAKIDPTTTSPTTTKAPTTTTEKPIPSSTTPPPPPFTTTSAPAPITTAAPPTPTPAPEMGKWSYTQGNQTCLIVQMALQLNFTYETKAGNKTVLYSVPSNRTTLAGGDCGIETNKINLQWDNNNHFALDFNLNRTTQRFYLSAIAFQINASDVFPDAKANQIIMLYHLGSDFNAPLDMSYHCTRVQTLNLTKNHEVNSTTIGYVLVSKIQLEPFHHAKGDSFSSAKDCDDAIDTPDIVPIAVGCALAALVIVVLIAYLVGRRRSQARGYLSM